MNDKGAKPYTDKHKECGYIGYYPAQARMINTYDRGYIIDIDRQDHQEHYNARRNQDSPIKRLLIHDEISSFTEASRNKQRGMLLLFNARLKYRRNFQKK